MLYMTRIQQERFSSPAEYEKQKVCMCSTGRSCVAQRKICASFTLWPRVDEITVDVDDDPRAAYFDQVQNGVYMRMALIMTLLGLKDPKTGEVAFNVEG